MKTTFTKDELINYLENKGNQVVAEMHKEHDYETGIKLNTELKTITEIIDDLALAIKGE